MVLEALELSRGSVLLPPPEKPNRRIEVYGNSVSAGEVSEAVDYVGKEDPEHNGEYSNSWYSYRWMIARKLGAQIHDIAQGESLCSITRDGSMRRTISEWRPLGIKSIIIRSLALQLTGTFPCIVRSL